MKPFVKMTGMTPGHGPVTMAIKGVPAFTPLICYEVIFPGAVTPSEPARRPLWLINITNDAWYGDSPGPRQHFAQARFRAIEEGLPVVRAGATGVSGVIDPFGRVLDLTPLGTAGARTSPLPLPSAQPTVYSRSRDWPFIFLVAVMSLCALISIRRNGTT